jgi:hypothetical protein
MPLLVRILHSKTLAARLALSAGADAGAAVRVFDASALALSDTRMQS